MRGRLFSLCCLLLLSFAAVGAAQAASLAQQRLAYDQAKSALARGDKSVYLRHASLLKDYPLEPYLAYDELTARLKWASNQEIEKFLVEHGDLPHHLVEGARPQPLGQGRGGVRRQAGGFKQIAHRGMLLASQREIAS